MKNTNNISTSLISVIIPVYNDTARLKKCLTAIQQQQYPPDLIETIVVNNDPSDSLDSIKIEFPHVKLIIECTAGSYVARNTGIKRATGKIIAFTDSDCIPEENWLRNGIKQLESNTKVGLIGGKIELFYKNPNHLTPAEIYEKHTAFQQQRYIKQYHFAATANMLTRKEVLDHVGLFNENLKSSGDKEWGERVNKMEYQLVYADDVNVKHPARYSLKELYSKRTRVIGGSEALRKKSGILSIIDYDLLDGMIPPIKEVKIIIKSNSNIYEKIVALSTLVSLNIHSTLIRLRLRLGGEASR